MPDEYEHLRESADEAASTDISHRCADGNIVLDADVATETNEHGDRWCRACGERILKTT